MTHPSELRGRRLALVVWGEKPDGSDDVAVLAGAVEWDGHRARLLDDSGEVLLRLQPEWFDRLRPVDESQKATLLGAEVSISLKIGPLPAGADMTQFVKTGLRWPADDAR